MSLFRLALVPFALLSLVFACKSEKPVISEPISAVVALAEITPEWEDETPSPRPPVIGVTSARLEPSTLRKASGARIIARAAEGISLLYEWRLNGYSQGLQDSAAFEGTLTRGDVVEAVIHPSRDGLGGKPVILPPATVENSAPQFLGASGAGFQLNGHIFPVKDPDGDTLRYSLEDAPSGLSIDEKSGRITLNRDEISRGSKDPYDVRLLAEDGHGGEVRVHFPVSVSK